MDESLKKNRYFSFKVRIKLIINNRYKRLAQYAMDHPEMAMGRPTRYLWKHSIKLVLIWNKSFGNREGYKFISSTESSLQGINLTLNKWFPGNQDQTLLGMFQNKDVIFAYFYIYSKKTCKKIIRKWLKTITSDEFQFRIWCHLNMCLIVTDY